LNAARHDRLAETEVQEAASLLQGSVRGVPSLLFSWVFWAEQTDRDA
jgi:hypothetical protein